ncbi:Dam family site-specific DNA-(adenine-N6)-methyltransferase [Xanthomonas sp. 3058]|uniref:DNA adenine methylase n=1 Tax=Xanthomonas sp. 3058 TaxID=3035314 RepID=UPI00161E45AD|nr:Dam family site-specific DNA-(adenine-N6)-methyltransferase [Xanthomonas sp. 3058]MBB5865097.1 DNA adenine methylase [Xanthomonas sp. 3058]
MTQNLVDLLGKALPRAGLREGLRKRPLLRWAGSKQRLIPELCCRLPTSYQRYIEPFAGSASLFFEIRPRKALLSDINKDLINFYRIVKKSPDLMHDQLIRMKVDVENYQEVRRSLVAETDPHLRALYFWYLNRTCFNGLYRTNRDGIFNVPFGKKLPQMPARQQVLECVKHLKKASLLCSDYRAVVGSAEEGDFIYVDPPYRRGSARNRGEYGPGAMVDSDMAELINALSKASARGVKILLSYNACLEKEFPAWRHEILSGRHMISADPAQRAAINEYTSRNY